MKYEFEISMIIGIGYAFLIAPENNSPGYFFGVLMVGVLYGCGLFVGMRAVTGFFPEKNDPKKQDMK